MDPMFGAANTFIYPMLSVRRGAQAIEFYKKAFGAEELFRIGEEGKGVVAQMSVGGAEFWLADEAPECGNFSPESLAPEFRGGWTGRGVVEVGDPEAVVGRTIEA